MANTKKTALEVHGIKEPRDKKLALVVHGIGEQNPGETIEALVGGLVGATNQPVTTDMRLMRETDVDHLLDTEKAKAEHEKAIAAQGDVPSAPPPAPEPKAQRNFVQYPCHIHRIEGTTKDYVFAEVFWGDISRGADGTVRGVLDLFELVMGLGHIVRANAAEIYDSPKFPPRFLANGFVYLLHGPLPALNFVFAIGIVLLFGLQYLQTIVPIYFDPAHITVFCTIVLLLLIHKFSADEKRSYLYQTFHSWLFYMAIIMCAVFSVTVISILVSPAFFESYARIPTQYLITDGGFVIDNLDVWYSAIFVNMLAVFGGLCLSLVVVNATWEVVRRAYKSFRKWLMTRQGKETPSEPEKALYPQASVLMITVWMLMVSILWVIGSRTLIEIVNRSGVSDEAINKELLETYMSLAMQLGVAAMCALLVIILSAIMVHLRRSNWVKAENKGPEQEHSVPRLIVNPTILLGLTLALVVLTYGATLAAIEQFSWLLGESESDSRTYFGGVFIVSALGIAAVYSKFGGTISMGIGVAKDIVVYFVRRPNDKTKVERNPDDKTDPNNYVNEYPLRQRIQNRFVDTLIRLIEIEKPTEILIISHSQGTVIALEALRGGRLNKILTDHGLPEISPELVTMGSPTDHLYGFYFSKTFSVQSADENMDVETGISKWTNIYRSDDFVGTTVAGRQNTFPHNEKVLPNGHTNYWTDELVLKKLVKHALPELNSPAEIQQMSQANQIENLY
ncbi:hypothetical protein [Amylibacter sp. IMCC11727]|uniref:hypothetical protein n=1 Tax=Amylibacter sp. IMCC11727 TaxID=3039851 RepID=UPI00244E2283|nr:hypothetical protein [Amylibacter sp. IMCC11727]WGI23167.1 hypothetical protein QBD29_07025 [Amylibacter sp. IMCC11727]